MSSSADKTRTMLSENLSRLKSEIARVAQGREVALVCVTKYVGKDVAGMLVEAGATDLGENRIMEGAAKYDALVADGLSFKRHMIGQIQSNKAARIPVSFDWCQSLSREKIADILEASCKARGSRLDVTVEVNIGSEQQKDGVMPGALFDFIGYVVERCRSLVLRGLMCIPPVADERTAGKCFSTMKCLFEKAGTVYGEKLPMWDTLSMGMSADFAVAIREGATMVRVGSVLYRGLDGFCEA